MTITPPPVPTATPAPQVLPEVSEILLGCAGRDLMLEDVVPAGRRVKLLGWTLPRNAGKTVILRLRSTGRIVATPTVQPTGRFGATVKAPRGSRAGDRTRYEAILGDNRSPALKLWRRLQVSSVQDRGDEVRIRGQVTRPLARRAADRTIEVREQVDCKPGRVIARVKPSRSGRFTVRVPRSSAGAVYRLHTRVRTASGAGRLANTYSLPRVVEP